MALKMEDFAVNFGGLPPVTTRKGVASPVAQERLGGTEIERSLMEKLPDAGLAVLEVRKECLCNCNKAERGLENMNTLQCLVVQCLHTATKVSNRVLLT